MIQFPNFDRKNDKHCAITWQLAPSCWNQYSSIVSIWLMFFFHTVSFKTFSRYTSPFTDPSNHTTRRHRPSIIPTQSIAFRLIRVYWLVTNICHFDCVDQITLSTTLLQRLTKICRSSFSTICLLLKVAGLVEAYMLFISTSYAVYLYYINGIRLRIPSRFLLFSDYKNSDYKYI